MRTPVERTPIAVPRTPITVPRKAIVPYVGSVGFDGVDDYVDGFEPLRTGDTNAVTFDAVVLARGTSAQNILRSSDRVLMAPTNTRCSVDGSLQPTLNFTAPKTWYRVTGIFDADNGVQRVYIDGVLVASQEIAVGELTLTGTWAIGKRPSGSEFLNALVATARIYKRALTTPEVETLHYTNTTPYDHTPDCVLNLETLAGRVSGGTWTDTSPAGNHATLSGAALVEGVAPTVARTIIT